VRILPQTIKQWMRDTLNERIVASPLMTRAARQKFFPFDMIFTDVWREYLWKERPDISDKLKILCAGMDEISREIAATVADRYFYLAPPCRFNEAVVYRTDQLYTAHERELQSDFRKRMEVADKRDFWLPNRAGGLSESVFAMHNGIDLIPDAGARLSGSSVIDGGAFVGDSALTINDFGPKAIYCFEPDEENRRLLRETITHNSLTNVTIVNSGLGGVEGQAAVSSDASQTKLISGEAGIHVTTIDGFCEAHGVTPALIKLDVEGMEYEVIQGGLMTIAKHKPLMIISVYHTPRDFFEIKPIIDGLGLGYTFMLRRLSPSHLTNETVLICY
jgi:FkbM family methyltransferase